MQKYDLTVLVAKADVSDKVDKLVKALGGKAGRTIDMGKKQLAYPINKVSEALFFSWGLELEAPTVLQLEKKLTTDRDIIRHLLVKTGN